MESDVKKVLAAARAVQAEVPLNTESDFISVSMKLALRELEVAVKTMDENERVASEFMKRVGAIMGFHNGEHLSAVDARAAIHKELASWVVAEQMDVEAPRTRPHSMPKPKVASIDTVQADRHMDFAQGRAVRDQGKDW